MHEVAVVPPQQVGPFTPLYKRIVPWFKYFPLKSAVIVALFVSFFLYIILGITLVKLASLLQFGF
jgi:hypothetical protein